MKKHFTFLAAIFLIVAYSCDKETIEYQPSDGYIIGFDPCEGDVKTSNRGFIIACNNLKDTFVTYNLPDTIFAFPQYLFSNYINSCMFPDKEYLNYKINFKYRFANENEKFYPLCIAIIYIWEFSQFNNRQVILNKVTQISPKK